ncbi:hypothetical protein BKP35_02530 [Anaerobacillus arseniciselenatis]|uniref:Uncharacterized protein n=1 Tax=Anaerobacillus arseniciselenatis TaxID=85682 RepID=A0A1S2LU87_9BACI|nr:hypothetical protein [Anaerobacillus arseniciselenatis]OIJ15884.1 hypothetical protein BKP35_02530 [Anaerobacillus arseniciselenatis]
MKKRLTFLLVGFLCLNLSISTFPLALNSFTTEILMHKLVFEPFKWLGSILLFISGFFTISRLIKMISENVTKQNSFNREALWIALIILGFIFIAFNNFLVSIAAFVFSAFYGIMDANVHRKSRYYNN